MLQLTVDNVLAGNAVEIKGPYGNDPIRAYPVEADTH